MLRLIAVVRVKVRRAFVYCELQPARFPWLVRWFRDAGTASRFIRIYSAACIFFDSPDTTRPAVLVVPVMGKDETPALTLLFDPRVPRVAGETIEGEVDLYFPTLVADNVEEVHVKLRGSVLTYALRIPSTNGER